MATTNGPNGEASTALAIIPRSLDDVRSLAKMVAGSILLPEAIRKEPDIAMAIMAGLELGLPPAASIRGVHVIKGKPTLSAQTMVGVVLGRGLAEYFECVDEKPGSVTYETKRRGGRTAQRATWTLEDAKRAGLTSGNWASYPQDMLHARCMSRLARRVYPDLLAGIYDPDEIENSVGPELRSEPPPRHSGYADAVDAEIVADAPPAESYESRIEKSDTVEALKLIAPEINKLPKGSRERESARNAYMDRMKAIEQKIQAALNPNATNGIAAEPPL